MKRIIFLHKAINISIALLLVSCKTFNDVPADSGITKIIISNENSAMSVTAGRDYLNAVNIKVIRQFIKHFENAKNVSWNNSGNGGYVARFKNDSVQTEVRYDNRGFWECTLKKYPEKYMPRDLQMLVKGYFLDYAIIEVTEVEQPRYAFNNIYYLLIQNADNYKTVRIYDGEIEITGDFTKP